jgi:EmrB/QacA subfamily drug resistance transporter
LALVQFMIVIDNTVVNVALPSIQRDLRMTETGLAWVVNGYLLVAGGFLLLGGRIADLIGRRRMFLVGTGVFAIASLLAGLAQDGTMLIAARFAQGAGEAVAAPAALSMVPLLFTNVQERAKAFGVWGGLAGLGATVGVILSGVITGFIDWRWIFFINVPLAIIPLVLVPKLVKESRSPDRKSGVDVLGAVLVTGGTLSIVYGVLNAAANGWGATSVWLPVIGGIAALVAFIAWERTRDNPLVPMRFFANRTRVSANICTVLVAGAMMAMFFVVVLYTQNVLDYSPLQSGLAYMPFMVAFAVGLTASTKMTPKLGVRTTIAAGFAVGAVGMFLLARIPVDGSYWIDLMPALMVLALGLGLVNPALQNAALHEVSERDAGLASGVQQTVMQAGSALGLAVLVTIALRRSADLTGADLTGAGSAVDDAAAVAGYRFAFLIAGIVLAVGAVAALVLMEKVRPTTEAPAASEAAKEPQPVS